ncbi:hypothetical protein ECZU06_34380 [Escherichia coli]|nr:hypothetical protein ECZU06_34380 [Escherichia coli]GHL74399.1 hypothetical protein ECZU34_21470 [Escherichia coli]
MKQPGEELQETLTELDDRAVVDYLIKNPEFFIRNARAVEAIRVPHPVRGTVSLVEWHMARARNHIHVLEENMALLMEQAIANEGLFYRLLYLQRSLTAASSLDDMLMRFHRWARDLGGRGEFAPVSRSLALRCAVEPHSSGIKPSVFRTAAYSASGAGTALSGAA